MRLCQESIDKAAYRPGSTLARPSRFAPRHRSPLLTGREPRRAQQRVERRRPRFSKPMLTIRTRAFPFEERAEAGLCEGDLILGKDQRSAMGTLVERQTRLVRLLHIPALDSDHLHDALTLEWVTDPQGCFGQSHGTKVWRWHATSTSPRPSAPVCVSAPRALPGSAAPTRTPTVCSGSICRREPTSQHTPPSVSARWRTSSNGDPESPLANARRPTSSTSCWRVQEVKCCAVNQNLTGRKMLKFRRL
jgi:hypothetical protein